MQWKFPLEIDLRIVLPLLGYIIDCGQSQTDYKMDGLPKMAGLFKKSNYTTK